MPSLTEYAFAASSNPIGGCQGPDGNLWVCLYSTSKIARITPGGTVTEFACVSGAVNPLDICSDGTNLWYTATDCVVKVSGALTGTPTQTKYGSITGAYGIAYGPDGNLWVTNGGTGFMKVTTGGSLSNTYTVAQSGSSLRFICTDGVDLYATNRYSATGGVSRCTTAGSTQTTVCPDTGAGPIGICSDGTDVYVTGQDVGKLYKVTTGATQTFTGYTIGGAGSQVNGCAVGPDGRIYVAGYNASFNNLYSIPAGGGTVTTETAFTTASANAWDVFAGSAGAVWVNEYGVSKIAKWSFVGVAKTGTGETGSGSESSSVAIAPATPSASDTGTGTDTGGAAGVVYGVGVLGGSATLMNDLFIDTAGTALQSHTPDGGGTWARVGGSNDTYPVKINASGRAYPSTPSSGAALSNAYEHSLTIADATWEIEWVIASSGGESYLGARKGSDGGGYNVVWLYLDNGAGGNAGRLTLQKRVGGVISTLGSPYDISGYPGATSSQKARLACYGSDIRVSLLIGSTWTEIIVVTDTSLTSGVTGLWLNSSTSYSDLGVGDGLQVNYVSVVNTSTLGVETGTGSDASSGAGPSVTSKAGSETATGDDQRALKAILNPTSPSPGADPVQFGTRQTVQVGDIQNAPEGFVECNSGKMLFAYNPSAAHAGSGSIALRTAANEAAANAGTFTSAVTLLAEDSTYYYGMAGLTKVAEGAHAGRVWLSFVRADTATSPDTYWAGFMYTDDEGASWSSPIYPSHVFTGNTALHGDLVAAPITEIIGSGGQEFVIPIYGWDTGNANDQAWLRLLRTTDGGATWSSGGTISAAITNTEQAEGNICPVRLANGAIRYLCVYNTYNSVTGAHIVYGRYSDDGCATWSSAYTILSGYGGAPAIIQSADGAVMLLTRSTVTDIARTYWARSTDYGATFTVLGLLEATGNMRYGQWGNLASGRLGLVYGTETNFGLNAAVYWKTFTLSPATAGQGQETATGADSSSVSVVVGATAKNASDIGTGTDSRVLAVTVTKNASDIGTGFDSSGSSTVPSVITYTRPFLAPLDVFNGSAPLDLTYTED